MLVQRESHKNIIHALFTACVLAIGVVALLTINHRPNTLSQVTPSSQVVNFTGQKDKTVLEQLQNEAEVEAKITATDTTIKSINGIDTTDTTKEWHLYINDQLNTQNPRTITTTGGEDVQWRFE